MSTTCVPPKKTFVEKVLSSLVEKTMIIYVWLAIGWMLVSQLHFWLVDVKRNIRFFCCCGEFYFKWLGGETCHHQVI